MRAQPAMGRETLVGRVQTLWRYPVKSMLGERVAQTWVSETGVCGDRAYALWDHATGRVASAKNPKLWRNLLGWQARYPREPRPGAPPVPVAMRTAGRPELLSTEPEVDGRLSEQLGRRVSLLDRSPEGASLDQYWPPVEGRAFQDVVKPLELPQGLFFDACTIHALTSASLEHLRQLEPGLDFAVERFRPNLLIATPEGERGFVEEGWVGHRLRLGDGPELRVDGGCPRCVITTLPQGDLPEEMGILRATARHNQVVAGIRLSVVTPGRMSVGDAVTLLED